MPFNIIINQEVIDVAFLSRAPSWRDVIDGEPFLEVAPCCLSFQGAFILKDTACLPLISDKLPSRSYQLEGVGQVLLLIVGLTKKKACFYRPGCIVALPQNLDLDSRS